MTLCDSKRRQEYGTKKIKKRVGALLLAGTMLFSSASQFNSTVYAEDSLEDSKKVAELQEKFNELDVEFELKGATKFTGTPISGVHEIMNRDRKTEVEYDGWQLMELNIIIPYQDGLEVTSITPSIDSLYPQYSVVERDDKNSQWCYSFYFKQNGTYDFAIRYSLNGEENTINKSYSMEGLVSIKDIKMRRHLIDNYGEFSGVNYGEQYVTREILSTIQYDPWGNIVYDFGKDGDNGSTARYTTSLDGLQYLTNIHGMYLYDCAKLAEGETIEPITKTYYPNMKLLRLTNITDSSNKLPKGSYNSEMIAAAIKNMPNLYELSISGMEFKDLPVIGELNGELGYLEADYNEIESIEGIEKHPNLYSISLGINKIKSIEPLRKANLSHVTFMDLGGNQIFDLSPMKETLPSSIVGGKRFGARRQTVTYEKTVIANLKNDIYEIELPMPIDIDGALTDTSSVTVTYEKGGSKTYATNKVDGKTYISIPKNDVDNSKQNPFDGAKFKFEFNNSNGNDTRTKTGFTGTVTFEVSPVADSYHVLYEFKSGTRGKGLPEEVTELLPVDEKKYEEGATITAIAPEKKEIQVSDGVWTFKGYDADSKVANAENADKNRNVKFTGTWEFTKNEYRVLYEFKSGTKGKGLPEEVTELLPVDEKKYGEGATITAIVPEKKEIQVSDGVWIFKGYDADSKVANAENADKNRNIKFIGTWEFELNASGINHIPIISASDKTFKVGDAFNNEIALKDVTAYDEEDKDVTDSLEVMKHNVDTAKAGTYYITYKATDSQGASSTKTINVNVYPTPEVINHIPVIKAEDKEFKVGDAFNNEIALKDVTAYDEEDKDVTDSLEVIKHDVDTAKAGTYYITYKATDSQGASSTKTINVNVYPTPEVINHIPVIKAEDKEFKVGDAFNNEIALKDVTAYDEEDKDVTDSLEVMKHNVDTAKAGTYYITYKATDSQGASSTKTINVNVYPTPEVINHIPTINANDKTLTVGEKFEALKDVTATDKEDGDITDKVEILKNEVDTEKAGVYEVTYKVTDSQGASATKTVYVTVNPKMEGLNHIPTINASDKTLTVGEKFEALKGVTATDKEDRDLTDKVEILKNEVDTEKAGVYEVTYKVTDSQGASATKTVYVTVNPKMEGLNHIPTINANDKTLTVGEKFEALKDVTATDKEDRDLTDKVEILKNEVDTEKAGVYEVTYKVTDSQGASATKTVYVTVNPKMEGLNHIPTINANDKTLTVGEKFEALKDVTATDKEDGDITDKVEILKNEVDTEKAGVYEVTYKVTDSQGASVIKTIKVVVKDKEVIAPTPEPEEPTKPEPPKEPEISSPKTGDSSNINLWLSLFVTSGLFLVALNIRRKIKH